MSARRSMKRKRRKRPAKDGDVTLAITGNAATATEGKMHHGEAQVVGRFLGLHGLFSPFADAVRAAKGSRVALDDLAAWLLKLLQAVARPEDRAAQHKRLLLSYRSAPLGEKAARREVLAVLLRIKSKSVDREARRVRRGGPGKPGRPRRGK